MAVDILRRGPVFFTVKLGGGLMTKHRLCQPLGQPLKSAY